MGFVNSQESFNHEVHEENHKAHNKQVFSTTYSVSFVRIFDPMRFRIFLKQLIPSK